MGPKNVTAMDNSVAPRLPIVTITACVLNAAEILTLLLGLGHVNAKTQTVALLLVLTHAAATWWLARKRQGAWAIVVGAGFAIPYFFLLLISHSGKIGG